MVVDVQGYSNSVSIRNRGIQPSEQAKIKSRSSDHNANSNLLSHSIDINKELGAFRFILWFSVQAEPLTRAELDSGAAPPSRESRPPSSRVRVIQSARLDGSDLRSANGFDSNESHFASRDLLVGTALASRQGGGLVRFLRCPYPCCLYLRCF